MIIISGIVKIEIIVLMATVSDAYTLSRSYFVAKSDVTVATGQAAQINTAFETPESILSRLNIKTASNGINISLTKQTKYIAVFLNAKNKHSKRCV